MGLAQILLGPKVLDLEGRGREWGVLRPWKLTLEQACTANGLGIERFYSQVPASMTIGTKQSVYTWKRVQLSQDLLVTPTWPPFHCFGTPIWPLWRHVKTLHEVNYILKWVITSLISSFFLLVDYCNPNPCKNKGVCVVEEEKGYSCACEPGFAGFHCQGTLDDL